MTNLHTWGTVVWSLRYVLAVGLLIIGILLLLDALRPHRRISMDRAHIPFDDHNDADSLMLAIAWQGWVVGAYPPDEAGMWTVGITDGSRRHTFTAPTQIEALQDAHEWVTV